MSRTITGSGLQQNPSALTPPYPPIVLSMEGPYYVGGPAQEALVERVPQSMTVHSAVLLQKLAGFSGDLTVQVEVSRDQAQTWTALFAAPINLSYLMGNYAVATALTKASARNLNAGDLLRLNLLNVQAGGEGFSLYLAYEATG